MLTSHQTPSCATQFRWLRTVDESIQSMLRAIEEARDSVRLEMYIYSATGIGEQFRDALVRASQRGVRVKVLLDSWGSVTLAEKFWDPLRAVGGEFRWFNRLSLERGGIRNHRKLLVCDEAVAFVGGFNISSEYQGDGVTRGWFDLGLEAIGYFAQELAASFDTMYAVAEFRHRLFVRVPKSVDQKIVSTADGQIILAGPGHNPRFLKSVLLNDLRSAKSIRIIAAYFLPLRPIRRALSRAARRGSRVQIIVAAKSDVPWLLLAFRRFYHSFLRAGVEIYEYQPQVLHAKLIMTDHVVYVGSANLDRRSFLANYELLLRLTQHQVAREGQGIFEASLAHCRRVDATSWKTSRSFWDKLKERWAFFLLARLDLRYTRQQLRNLR